ncbi:MAG: DUF2283 domain-containing protein [bacterium]|nr:DUF2283 domain-containing protein [bacterium]
MEIKYFSDTDTVLVNFTNKEVVETRDLSENVLLDLDKNGNIVSMTVEHARRQTNMNDFSFQQIHSPVAQMA